MRDTNTTKHKRSEKKFPRNKERLLEAASEKVQVTYRGRSIRITSDISTESLKARRPWIESSERIQMTTQATIPSKTVIMERETICDRTGFKELMSTKSALQRILEGTVQSKEIKYTQEYRE